MLRIWPCGTDAYRVDVDAAYAPQPSEVFD